LTEANSLLHVYCSILLWQNQVNRNSVPDNCWNSIKGSRLHSLRFIIIRTTHLIGYGRFTSLPVFLLMGPVTNSDDFEEYYHVSSSPVEVYRSFGRTYCFHLQDRRVRQARSKQQFTCSLFKLLFGPKYEGSKFLQNVDELLTD
jgi:hypothetical protein